MQLADGRTRAFVNDQPVSVQVLKALGAALVEIHGQHDERALVDVGDAPAAARCLCGPRGDAAGGRARRGPRAAPPRRRSTTHRARVEQARREADWLRHAVEELTRLKPEAGEETALAERRAAMMQADKVAEDLRDAHEAVAGERSPVAALSAALRRLERRRAQAPALIEPAVKALDAALTALDEARGHLDAALRAADHDPRELERIEERLFALRAAGRKYNVAGRRSRGAEREACGRSRGARCRRGGTEALEAAAREAEAALSRRPRPRCRRRAGRRPRSSTRR